MSEGSGAVCAKTTPLLVIPKPGLSARNLLAASSETADSSRDNAALRNDNPLEDFQTAPLPVGAAFLDVHLVDGTYELFRHYYALPSARDRDGREVAAVRGVLASVLGMIKRRRHARRRCDRSRHRVVPQWTVAGLQDRRRHRTRPAGAVPAARRRPLGGRRRRLADGGVRGGRCARCRRRWRRLAMRVSNA